MRILHVLDVIYPCGTSKHVAMLAASLRERGHEVSVFGSSSDWLLSELAASGVQHRRVDLHSRSFLARVPSYVRHIRRHRIQVIHAHLTRPAYCAWLLGRLTQRPVAASVHTVTHDLVFRRLIPSDRNRIVCVSDYVRNTLLEQRVPPRYLKTIYNGTDLLQSEAPRCESSTPQLYATRDELGIPRDAEVVGLVGHGEPKGYTLLIRAAARVAAHRPAAHFAFVGTLTSQETSACLELAAALGVSERIHLLGCRPDSARLMEAMDVVTLPSEMETFGMVLVEAMALRKPVVASRVGGIPEVVEEGRTGLLVDRNENALAESITALLSDPERRRAMGAAGHERVRTLFSVEAMCANYEALYSEMIGGGVSE